MPADKRSGPRRRRRSSADPHSGLARSLQRRHPAPNADSGVRRYASSNDPVDVEADCRAGILELAAKFCGKNPDEQNCQASWMVFKDSGEPATGSEMLFVTSRPLTVTRDERAANVQTL